MDFFKSILSEEDPDPPSPQNTQPDSNQDPNQPNLNSSSSSSSNSDHVWSFGGFIKTLSTRSESVIETYRRDLEEFRTGLQKETELFKEAATRAVKDLPGSIEVGASVAQGMIKSTAEIISQGKDTFLSNSESDNDVFDGNSVSLKNLDSVIYSRFDAQLRAIQCDVGTFVEDPEDAEEYGKWKVEFVLEERREEIDKLKSGGGEVAGMFVKLVPSDVDEETFWCRYFYRAWELKRRENVRASLVKRAIAVDDDEELSWDVDDDEDEEDEVGGRVETEMNVGLLGNETNGVSGKEESLRFVDVSGNERKLESSVDEGNVVEGNDVVGEDDGTTSTQVNNEKSVLESDENVAVKGVGDEGESSKESNVSVVPTRTLSREEEDLEWDEIEDVEGNDEKKVSHAESPSKADTRKRLSVAEEDEEDLSWDIEDDDEPAKANAK